MVQVFEYDIDPGPMVSPATGALVNRDDNDELLMAFKDAEDLEKDLRRFKAQIRDTLWSRTVDGGTKTRHIEGRKVSATLVEQDPSPNTTVLKQILRSFPDAAKNVIVPSGYRVDKTQWKKMQATASQCDDFNAVKNMVVEAFNSGSTPPPRITKLSVQ
ncbi:hypothetical protein [Rubinisphaera brasiliensis]|uniref:Uncharacterized protein n=1 Tax=Rubinisphaera brasiliensis (strain ATCC 49424 / DSM 5305 / JCM 21570 / IAM 15109 / NBRC 103401 / IFAM 1448) TaxID=756272 RepID=F0SNJ3_RUBBR|nr:hypothetical protein [Rubinisphaera brasiliensis]ADY57827.1 hypothetical protein Plabr_0197 [Rubinisphaera brasiliensis DSM 5305]